MQIRVLLTALCLFACSVSEGTSVPDAAQELSKFSASVDIPSGPLDIYVSAVDFRDDFLGSGTATYSAGGMWTLVGQKTLRTALMLPVGMSIVDLQYSVNRASGQTSAALISSKSFGSGAAGNLVVIGGSQPAPGTWGTSTGISPGTPHQIQPGFIYTLTFGTVGTGTTLFDGVRITVQDLFSCSTSIPSCVDR